MQAPISKRLLECFGCPIEEEPELRKELNSRLNNICKPCWELKYCPYGPLVEDFPNYVTKTTLGKDSSKLYNIYKYEFTPKEYDRTIVLLSNVLLST